MNPKRKISIWIEYGSMSDPPDIEIECLGYTISTEKLLLVEKGDSKKHYYNLGKIFRFTCENL